MTANTFRITKPANTRIVRRRAEVDVSWLKWYFTSLPPSDLSSTAIFFVWDGNTKLESVLRVRQRKCFISIQTEVVCLHYNISALTDCSGGRSWAEVQPGAQCSTLSNLPSISQVFCIPSVWGAIKPTSQPLPPIISTGWLPGPGSNILRQISYFFLILFPSQYQHH